MTDAQQFLLILAVLYLLECLIWARRNAVLFTPALGRGWRITTGDRFFGHHMDGLFLTCPVPIWGAPILCELPPLSLSPDGVLSYTAQSFQPGHRQLNGETYHAMPDIKQTRSAGKSVLVNDRPLVKTNSPASAAAWQSAIQRIARAPAGEREAAIRETLHGMTHIEEIRSRYARYNRQAAGVNWICTVLFVYMFVVAPWTAWRTGLGQCWLTLLICLFVLVGLVAWTYAKAHKALYPDRGDERWPHVVKMVLFPPAAVRAGALLSRDLLCEYHPLAVAQVLCSRERFRRFARNMLLDLANPARPIGPEPDSPPGATEAWSRSQWGATLARMLADAGESLSEITQPPQPDEPQCKTYCPRCLCQFVKQEGDCESCGGIPLRKFVATDAPAP